MSRSSTRNSTGVVNGASFAAGAAVAPGSIASAFGVNLAPASASADRVPLPSVLGPVRLHLANLPAPLFFVSATQANFQIPWEASGQTQAQMTAQVGEITSGGQAVRLAAFAPGIFTTAQTGSGQGAILIANTSSLAAPRAAFPGSRPAMRGEFILIFCTGLGPVTNRPPTGAAAVASPLSETMTAPVVTVGGRPATVTFSGLAPGFVGLYQVNVRVPDDTPLGDAVPVVVTIAGSASQTVTMAIQ